MDRLTAWHASQTPALPGFVPAAPAAAPAALPAYPAPAPAWPVDAAAWTPAAYPAPYPPAYPAPAYPAPAYPAPAGYLDASIGQLMQQLAAIQAQIMAILGVRPAPPGPIPAPQPPAPAPQPPAPAPGGPRPATSFVVSSFNVLGSSHTKAGGNKPGMRSGPARIHDAVKLLDQHKVDVVGFQEFQGDQFKEFQKITGGSFGVYPGFQLGKRECVNSVAWRKDTWDLVKPGHVEVPYFDGHKRKMPVVLLRNKQTGQEAYFVNIHNPASTKTQGDHEYWRDEATRIEIDLVNRLQATGRPVIFTGDFNEREEAFEKITRGAQMTSADAPTGKPPKSMGIDWIFGSRGVRFRDYIRQRGPLVERTTDHPIVVARATIGG